jgi:antitoxin component YwqK of YwqJK toxin-antitoxin module
MNFNYRIALSIPLIYHEGMRKRNVHLSIYLVFLFASLMIPGCSSVVLIEQNSPDGQSRYYAKKPGSSSDTIYHGLYCQWYPNGTKKYEVTYKKGKKTGHETQWDAFGYKVREADFKNDLKNGLEIFWVGNGIKKREALYKNGLQNGLEITFSDDGKKVKEENYLNGKKDGVEFGYDSNGKKVYEVTYKEGKKHGQEIFYNYGNGEKPQATIVNWVDGNVVQ